MVGKRIFRRLFAPHSIRKGAAHGFNLIEIALLVLLAGIILSTYTEMERITRLQDRIDTVRERLTRIDTAIGTYLTIYGHLPCVAPLGGVPQAERDSASYGVETNCAIAPVAGVQSSGTGANTVYFGAVPTRTLNLPDEYMKDPWGNRFLYAVSTSLAKTATDYQSGTGVITVNNPAGASLGPATAYAVISAGIDGAGAYSDAGNVLHAACAGVATRDGWNCLYDRTDVRANSTLPGASLYAERSGANHYDDFVLYAAKKDQVLGAINRYIFDTMDCTPIAPSGCATVAITSAMLATAYHNPLAGPLLYDRTFTAESTGTAAIKVLVPVRYDNRTISIATAGIMGYESAILAALYVNGNPVVFGDVVNPAGLGVPETIFPLPFVESQTMFLDIGGSSGTIMGQFNITKGDAYTVRVYLFTLGAYLVVPGITFWGGTIKTADYNVEGAVEIMESGLQ